MKLTKKILLIVYAGISIPSIFCLLFALVTGVLYSDKNISGFAGFHGIYRLALSDQHVIKLTSSPIQYLAKEIDMAKAFDELELERINQRPEYIEHGGIVTDKDGTEYFYSLRSFTGFYDIITLEKR